MAIVNHEPIYPDVYDELRCQQLLDAVLQSAADQRWVGLSGQ